MSRRLFHAQLAADMAGDDRLRAERLRLLARSLIDIVRDALVRDGVVRIHGFGTFRLARMAARRGINPRTGEPIEIPARNRVLFRPAKALRDRIEPDHPAAVPLAEPHESREAWLGGTMADTPVAGGLPASGQRPPRSYFPDRVAAASMAESSARITAPAQPVGTRDSGSREANLGGAMADSPSAGRVATAAPDAGNGAADRPTADGNAANDDTVDTREPQAVGVTPEPAVDDLREAGAPREQPQRPPAPVPGREEVGGRDEAGEHDIPLLTEPGEEHEPEPARGQRRPAGILIAGLLLLLLALLLGWWLWPRQEPAPVASSVPGVETGRTDTVVTDTEPEAGDGGTSAEAMNGETAAAAASAGDAEPGSTQSSETVAGGESGTVGAVTQESSVEAAPADDTASSGVATGDSGEAGSQAAEPAAGSPETGAGSVTTTTSRAPWFSGREHTVAAGDTLWGLSDRHYVNPYYWPHVWNHNRSLADPDRIDIDQVLWLPQLEGEPRDLTAADRRSIAEGYLRLYRLWRDTGAANPQYALVGVRFFDPSVMPPDLRDDPSAGRPTDALAAAFEAQLRAGFPVTR